MRLCSASQKSPLGVDSAQQIIAEVGATATDDDTDLEFSHFGGGADPTGTSQNNGAGDTRVRVRAHAGGRI